MPTIILRSLLGRVATVVVGVLLAVVLAVVATSDGLADALQVAGWGGLLLLAVWALWYAPAVELRDEALLVRNAWRTHTIRWEAVVGCRTRWLLEVVTTGGGSVRASAAQRAGGLTTSWRRRQDLREREMVGGRSSSAIAHALEHRGVRTDFLDPGTGPHRAHLDSDAAGDLVEAYAERRADLERVRHRERHRQERLDGRRGGASTAGAARRPEAGPVSAAPPAGDRDAVGELGDAVRSRLNVLPVVASAVCLLLLLAGTLAG